MAQRRRQTKKPTTLAAAAARDDLLEMQETQNGVYLTVPEQQHSINDTSSPEIVIRTLATNSKRSGNGTSKSSNRNSSNGAVVSMEQQQQQQQRGKKIVVMPASLYNHFNPVESNIPIEDMSQFLYFGQKLKGTEPVSSQQPMKTKKLLEILDEEMNSVDRASGPASKSTKMRTTSQREHTTVSAAENFETHRKKNSSSSSATNSHHHHHHHYHYQHSRVVANGTSGTTSTTTTTSTSTSTTTTAPTSIVKAPNVTNGIRAASAGWSASSTSESAAAISTTQQQQQAHTVTSQLQRRGGSQLRNSTGSGSSGSSGSGVASNRQQQQPQLGSTGSSVEQQTSQPQQQQQPSSQSHRVRTRPPPSSTTTTTTTTVTPPTSHHQQKQQQQQKEKQSSTGFTIRWTDTRNKRRRLASSSRRQKSARNMDELSSSSANGDTNDNNGLNKAVDATSSSTTTTSRTTTTTGNNSNNDTANENDNSGLQPSMDDVELMQTSTDEAPKMLDASEVQKMYRAGSTSSSTTTTTTTPNSISSSNNSINTSGIGAESTVKQQVSKSNASASVSPERSPEVRGRNLDDKSKDDVLPIMQLYNNTSSMFNETIGGGGDVVVVVTPLPTERISTTSTTSKPTTSATITSTTTTTTTTSTTTTTTRRPVVVNANNNYNDNNNHKNSHNRTTTSTAKTTPPPHNRLNSAGYNPLDSYIAFNGSSAASGGVGGVSVGSGGGAAGAVGAAAAAVGPELLLPAYGNVSEVVSRRHDTGDTVLASQDTVTVVSIILGTLLLFPIVLGIGLIFRRLIIKNRKMLEESDTSSEISCRKYALNLESGDYKMPIEKTMTKLPRIQHLCHESEKPPPPASPESRWEFPRDKLRLQTVLGEGNFGQVWKAEADDLTGHQGTTRLVAVKTVKEGASEREKEDLVRELEIMQKVGSHPNVVTLLGCCTEQEPHYLILEYVMYGKLLTYLRDHRTRQDFYNFSEDSAALTSRDLTVFGYCVARGMEYLASKKIIHRDMAARNVLVDHNKLCKIADFGMSRFADENGEVIETRHGQRNALPIRWMAPESLVYSLFTTKTDVWSFGILMWEIVTLGSTPYPDMTAREVMRSVQSGYRLERPSHCRSELFRVISRCWHQDPDRRPEFASLRRELAQLLEDGMNGHYVDLESFASECTD
uniref:receptor protein-tyrosine kinase n=1 Tax=Trichogramma kaykai TaxID=54128 RepID=A0ABD2W0Q1_9HYME